MSVVRKALLASTFAVVLAFIGTVVVGSYLAATVLVVVFLSQVALVVILDTPNGLD